MRITELHLRNIASIVTADIDFTKDLCDKVTGEPASVFLIGGDTGAGKSVILDGIAMALYKKTPRLDTVANKKQNSFRSEEGENVGINSIEQYTRMGIGPKDECYSEVAFEGNDGKQYRARLSLGMYMTNKSATSERHLEHRKPAWEYKVGTEDWQKENSGQTIANAIGLSFEQFCRMAMLAQGKFESFLTGDKSQREAVLEQLTNTEKFSDYGSAISQIFKEAEEKKNIQEALLGSEANKPLASEKVQEMMDEKAATERKKGELETAIARADARKKAIVTVNDNDATIRTFSGEKASVEEQMKGKEYVGAKAFVTQWDKTDKERHALEDLHRAQEGLDECAKQEKRMENGFIMLCDDINAREALRVEKEAEEAAETKAREDAQQKVKDQQEQIDQLTKKAEALKLDEVNAALNDIARQKAELGKLSQAAGTLANDKADEARQKGEIEVEKVKLEPAKEASAKASSQYEEKKALYEAANARFSTMNASVDETIISLRHQLTVGEECPLCGQKVDMIRVEDSFRQALSPLQEEKMRAKADMDLAEAARSKATQELAALESAVKVKENGLRILQQKIERQQADIVATATRYGMNPHEDIVLQTNALVASLCERESDLVKKQSEATEIQKQIAFAIEQKKPLDSALAGAQDKEQKAKDAVKALKDLLQDIVARRDSFAAAHPGWKASCSEGQLMQVVDIRATWNAFADMVTRTASQRQLHEQKTRECQPILDAYYQAEGKSEQDLVALIAGSAYVESHRQSVKALENRLAQCVAIIREAEAKVNEVFETSEFKSREELPALEGVEAELAALGAEKDLCIGQIGSLDAQLKDNEAKVEKYQTLQADYEAAVKLSDKWSLLNKYFGGTRFRTLVQSHILKPLLDNANIYLEKITDRYKLTCSEENEQLSILVQDNYMKQLRSSTVLSGGEKFMVSLALSLALSSLNRPDMNVNILFIDEGFGTLDASSLESVMATLETLKEIAGQSKRRVGIISHREELDERIPVQIKVTKNGQGRSSVSFNYEAAKK